MAIASTDQFHGDDSVIDATFSVKPRRRRRTWLLALSAMLLIALGVGGYYALEIQQTFSTIHEVSTPPPRISGSALGGSAGLTIDTGAAQTAVALSESATETPASAAAPASPSPTTTAEAPTQPAALKPTETVPPAATGTPAPPTSTPTPTATATPAYVPSEIERVVNGGFEQGADPWYLNEDVAVVSGKAHSGNQAAAIGAEGGYLSQRIFATAGSTYQLTVWTRLTKSSDGAVLGIHFWDADYNHLKSEDPEPTDVTSTAWTQFSLTYTVPADAASVEIYFWKPGNGAVMLVDDASVRGLIPAAQQLAGSASKSDGKSMNILLMGVDARPGEAIDSGVRPDSLMVLHLDHATGTCRVLSIPRDTRTELPGYGLTKINHALAVGGVDYEKLVVQNLLGLKINHYVLIDFNGFEGLVDAVGGVTIDVPTGFTATDGTTFVAGTQSMSGRQALSYARFRGGPDGDFGRINRQQQVIRALVARASGLNIVRSLNELLPAVADNLRTDLSARDMATLASDYRSRCTDQNVTMLSLDGSIATYQDPLLNLPLSYVIVDPAEIKSKVAELLDH